jgi:hypothetical protein
MQHRMMCYSLFWHFSSHSFTPTHAPYQLVTLNSICNTVQTGGHSCRVLLLCLKPFVPQAQGQSVTEDNVVILGITPGSVVVNMQVRGVHGRAGQSRAGLVCCILTNP